MVVGAGNAGANFHLDAGSTWFNVGGTNQFGGATNILAKPGLFFYDLAYNAADKTERLIGVPEAAAFEFASVGGAPRATSGTPPARAGSTVRPTCATASTARRMARRRRSG